MSNNTEVIFMTLSNRVLPPRAVCTAQARCQV